MELGQKFETEIGGRKVSVETGKYCGQTNGSVIVRCGDTMVMVNTVMAKEPRPAIDFFPLGVDYEEKMYAVGKIPGGFKRREGRASDKAVLTSRLIDRPLRPLFDKGFFNDVTVIATPLSVDQDIMPEPLAMLGSSIALSISDIPFAGPTGSVVVGLIDGEYIINPTMEQRELSRMHLTVSGTKEAVLMVEAGAKEVTEEEMLKGILFAHEEIKKQVAFVEEIVKKIGKEKVVANVYRVPEEIQSAVDEYAFKKMEEVYECYDRHERAQKEEALEAEVQAHFAEMFPEQEKDISNALYGCELRRHLTVRTDEERNPFPYSC